MLSSPLVMWSFPDDLEDLLWAAAHAHLDPLDPGALDPRALAAAVVARTHRYTDERERLHAPLAPRERARDLAARALFFTVADAAKIGVPLAELSRRGLLPAHEPLRVLDVGAGAGAMTLGTHAALPDRRLDVLAIDRDADALALLAHVAAARPALALRTLTTDLSRPRAPLALAPGPFDLILAGALLNELPAPHRLSLVHALLARLADDGALILVEPALRETARALHELRDALLAAGAAHVFAPCTRSGAPCPALADERDWCHEDRPFRAPPRLRALTARTGLRAEGLKFAYLTLRRASDALVLAPAGQALRVVSGPLDQKGTVERIACGADGRARLRVLRRHGTPDRETLGDARRGDVLVRAGDQPMVLVRPAEPV